MFASFTQRYRQQKNFLDKKIYGIGLFAVTTTAKCPESVA